MKKIVSLALASIMVTGVLASCSSSNDTSSQETTQTSSTAVQEQTITVAALESAYGREPWEKVVAAFESKVEGLKINLVIDKNLEDVIGPEMKAGNYPDVISLGVGRPAALTETLIKENAMLDLTDFLEMNVYGENIKVKDKIVPGFTDTLTTNPYQDGKTYLAPTFYSPTGLFYNKGLFTQKGWEVPKTWDEMWALGDKAKADGISLFTYPTTGYFDAFFFALLNSVGGPDFFNKVMRYEEGIWETAEAKQAFDIVAKLATYTDKTTVANANNDNFTKNQQLVLDNKALFMPNGTWVTGEMAEAPRAEGFEWGFTSLPAAKEGGDRYSFTFFEQAFIPAQAKNIDMGKQFLAFLYSDEVAKIFAEVGAVQPIQGVSAMLTGENQLFYSIYDEGAKAAMGGFAATEPVEGVNIGDTLFGTVNSIVSGDKTVEQWKKSVIEASDKLRAALK